MKKATLVLGLFLYIGAWEVHADAQQVPDEARRQLVQALGGGQFLVFRDRVQEELKLSGDQKQKLEAQFGPYVQATMQLFETTKDLKPEEREKELQEHRRKSAEKLSDDLKGVLDAKQQARLIQLQLQQAGVFALLGQNEAFLKLKITDEQRRRLMEVAQAMQEKIEPLIKQAQSGGKPEEIGPKMMKIRKEHEGKIEAIMTPEQKEQWKELLGKPFDLDDQS